MKNTIIIATLAVIISLLGSVSTFIYATRETSRQRHAIVTFCKTNEVLGELLEIALEAPPKGPQTQKQIALRKEFIQYDNQLLAANICKPLKGQAKTSSPRGHR